MIMVVGSPPLLVIRGNRMGNHRRSLGAPSGQFVFVPTFETRNGYSVVRAAEANGSLLLHLVLNAAREDGHFAVDYLEGRLLIGGGIESIEPFLEDLDLRIPHEHNKRVLVEDPLRVDDHRAAMEPQTSGRETGGYHFDLCVRPEAQVGA